MRQKRKKPESDFDDGDYIEEISSTSEGEVNVKYNRRTSRVKPTPASRSRKANRSRKKPQRVETDDNQSQSSVITEPAQVAFDRLLKVRAKVCFLKSDESKV